MIPIKDSFVDGQRWHGAHFLRYFVCRRTALESGVALAVAMLEHGVMEELVLQVVVLLLLPSSAYFSSSMSLSREDNDPSLSISTAKGRRLGTNDAFISDLEA